MRPEQIQTLVLRSHPGPAVAHLILRVADGRGRTAARLLQPLRPSFGPRPGELGCSIGFSYAGLEALGLPDGYLRLFRRQAHAFSLGAVRRSPLLGDSGGSAAPHWPPHFQQDQAHVLLSWHGRPETVLHQATSFAAAWQQAIGGERATALLGERLGAPPGESGQWVHFGFRDGISEVCIDAEQPRPAAPDCRARAAGALLLGEINDAGFNSFALHRAPDKVRAFFQHSSFGILRPMAQDLAAFEDQVDRWVLQLTRVYAKPVTRDFVKAKLCGRWPNGRQAHPGEPECQGSLVLDLAGDPRGEGCPFGSHVRRMRAAPDGQGNSFERPLQRRGLPYGPAAWAQCRPTDGVERGLLGQFFCASIEDQFEHLLGQWAARPPLGLAAGDSAPDPLTGPHDDAQATLAVPLTDRPTQQLRGFSAWATTRGTMYAWHPGREGLRALLEDDFVPEENERPWL